MFLKKLIGVKIIGKIIRDLIYVRLTFRSTNKKAVPNRTAFYVYLINDVQSDRDSHPGLLLQNHLSGYFPSKATRKHGEKPWTFHSL